MTVTVTQDGQSAAVLTSQHGATTADVWHFVATQSGTYHLSVAGRPNWQCTLNVSAK